MTETELQQRLVAAGYKVKVDGDFGRQSKVAMLALVTAGPDTPITPADIQRAATTLGVTPAHIWTVYEVEAAGNPFIDGRPAILFEPHIFSRLTGHRYDASHPNLSSRRWNKALYGKTQLSRWNQLLDAISLDPDAAIQSASYGGFQVLGTNWKALGYASPYEFLLSQTRTVGDQLDAFVRFVKANHLDDELRANNWAGFARGYNGPGYAANQYDKRLASRFAARSARG